MRFSANKGLIWHVVHKSCNYNIFFGNQTSSRSKWYQFQLVIPPVGVPVGPVATALKGLGDCLAELLYDSVTLFHNWRIRQVSPAYCGTHEQWSNHDSSSNDNGIIYANFIFLNHLSCVESNVVPYTLFINHSSVPLVHTTAYNWEASVYVRCVCRAVHAWLVMLMCIK